MYIFGMQIGNLTVRPPVVLAPMAGVTDGPFRRLCRRNGAGLVYSEFLSSDGLVRGALPQREKIAFTPEERPIGFQLFGARSAAIAEAAQMLCCAGPDLIDLNFGCPARKVIRKNGGAAVLKHLDLLEEIVKRTAESIDRPLTVKMRAGFEESNPVFIEAAQRAVRAGAVAITLHARSGQSGFGGPANWEFIRVLKQAVNVPVIGNGDIRRPADALAMMEQTGCDAVMIGRGALGRPWIFRQIEDFLQTRQTPPEPPLQEKFDVLRWHVAEEITLHGERRGILRMRRHMGWYVRGLPDAAELRQRLMTAIDYRQVSEMLSDYEHAHPFADATPPGNDPGAAQPLSHTRGPW